MVSSRKMLVPARIECAGYVGLKMVSVDGQVNVLQVDRPIIRVSEASPGRGIFLDGAAYPRYSLTIEAKRLSYNYIILIPHRGLCCAQRVSRRPDSSSGRTSTPP